MKYWCAVILEPLILEPIGSNITSLSWDSPSSIGNTNCSQIILPRYKHTTPISADLTIIWLVRRCLVETVEFIIMHNPNSIVLGVVVVSEEWSMNVMEYQTTWVQIC